MKRRNSLESSSEGGASDGNCLRRHKSLDGGGGGEGGGQSDLQKSESDEKEKDKKDPRLERRIRNKVGCCRASIARGTRIVQFARILP